METIFLDFETYYDTKQGYTLKKLTPPEYILDTRFEAIGCTFQHGLDGNPYWVGGPHLAKHFDSLTPEVMAVSHNWQFDGSIASWRYGWLPKLSCCTLSIARATLSHILGPLPSLAKVSDHLGLPPKGDTVHKVDGMCRDAIKANGLYDEYVNYCLQDTALCAKIFQELVLKRKLFPFKELLVLDAVLRCTSEPRFTLDQTVLAQHLFDVQRQKEDALSQIGADKKQLMSNQQFAALLQQYGVDPPMKTSPTTGKTTFAFSKTDVGFLALQEHDNPTIQALVSARLGVKSTIEETRAQRFIDISNLRWPNGSDYTMGYEQKMPMPIRYSAAATHRLGGDWKLNVQNMSRSNPIKPGSGRLRRAMLSPPGYKVMTVDSSQIEARMVVYFSGQENVVQQFRDKKDVYSLLASEIYRRPINKVDDPNERFVGKQAVLGLGYQLWWPKFKNRVKTDSINQLGYPIELAEHEAANVVETFRRLNENVVKAWKLLDTEGILNLVEGCEHGAWIWGACRFTRGVITGPSGLQMHYPNLEQGTNKFGKSSWFYYTPKKGRTDIYGGKLMENICQHLARVHTLEAAVRITKRTRKEIGTEYRLAQQAHDENVFIVKDEHVEDMRSIMREEMCRQDWWCPSFPFDCEIGVGQNYGEAK